MSEKDAPLDARPLGADIPVEKLVAVEVAGKLVERRVFEHVAKEIAVPEGKRVIEAVADTLDPAEVIDLIILEASVDGGKTWQEVGRATGARAAPAPTNPGDPVGPMRKPGLIARVVIPGVNVVTRTRVVHSKAMRALVADKTPGAVTAEEIV